MCKNTRAITLRVVRRRVLRLIDRAAFFPTELQFRHKGLAPETRELFGKLISKMEAYVDGGEDALAETSSDHEIHKTNVATARLSFVEFTEY